jgi:hypothetical protein
MATIETQTLLVEFIHDLRRTAVRNLVRARQAARRLEAVTTSRTLPEQLRLGRPPTIRKSFWYQLTGTRAPSLVKFDARHRALELTIAVGHREAVEQ